MKKITDYSSPIQFLIYLSILLGSVLVVYLESYRNSPQKDKINKEEAQERSRVDFCKKVLDVVKPDDKICGKYLTRIRKEIKDDEAAVALKAVAQKVAAERAVDPQRTLTQAEMDVCLILVRNAARDPSSIKIHYITQTRGGLIDFTATNGFGGPTRSMVQCTTGQVMN